MTALEFNYQITGMRKNLENFALSLTANNDDAQDLVQDTFLKALIYRDKYAEATNLKAWLFTIMKNTFINNYRRKAKGNTILDVSEDLYYLNNTREAVYDRPDTTYSVKEIERSINELDKEYRLPFDLYNKGYKYKEISDMLDLSIGTVKSRIFFTRQKLMEKLKDFES
jgi:RNA polymerase sigma factor (sigma-70 family)